MSNKKASRPLCLQMVDEMQKYILLDASTTLDECMVFARMRKDIDKEDARVLAHSAYVISQWRLNKQIFRIERTLYDDLIETEDAAIPMTALHLPYPCFYIDLSDGQLDNGIDGCFVLHDNIEEENKKQTFFSFVFISKHENLLEYSNLFVTSRISAGKTVQQVYDECFTGSVIPKEVYRRIFLILTYLSADNRDVIENEKQKHNYHPGQIIKNAVREIQQWDVGVRYAHTKHKPSDVNSIEKHGKSHARQKPHVRKAHWHLYWTGHGRKIPKVNWVAPCLVNVNSETVLPAVIHEE